MPILGGSPIAGQSKTITIPLRVEAVTPLANVPPGSFSVPFEKQFLAMASYWGTWACSNPLDNRGVSGRIRGPEALYQNSGTVGNTPFPPNSSSDFDNYDPAKLSMGTGDLLFSTKHSDWAASHFYQIGDVITHAARATSLRLAMERHRTDCAVRQVEACHRSTQRLQLLQLILVMLEDRCSG